MRKLAIISTHPIQYYAPVFQLLAKENIALKVFYSWGENSVKKYDPDFKRQVEWDIPLLDGYDFIFLENTSPNPGTAQFKGIINPNAVKEIDAFNPDVILIYGWSWHSHLKIIRHYAGKKAVWFRGDSTLLDNTGKIKSFVRAIFLQWIYKHVDGAFYVGQRNKEYFKKFGLKEEQLRFAPHSIDNNRFAENRALDAIALRTKLGIPPDGILILFAGKFESKKDPLSLLHAFIALENENTYLLFVGNGVLENELKETASASGKSNQIHFMDFQNQQAMPAIYQACQLYCLPSVGPGETWGLAINEAMAAGRAVLVSSKVGCAVDLVKAGVNGAIFSAGDGNDLKDQLSQLLSDPAKLRIMGEASTHIIENWSLKHQVSSILSVIDAN